MSNASTLRWRPVLFSYQTIRREIEDRRGGEDCERLLARMCLRGLLVKARADALRGDQNVFRLTAVALGATGHAALEPFQRWCDGQWVK